MKNPNFLILDEPTNDLDILTLNVLEEYLAGFRGCVIVVSHDRYFMDKVVDHIFEYKGNGIIKDFPGNYTQLRLKQQEAEKQLIADKSVKSEISQVNSEITKRKQGLTFKEKREFEALMNEIQNLEMEKSSIETEMGTGLLNPDELYLKSKRHGEVAGLLDDKEMKWLELSEKK